MFNNQLLGDFSDIKYEEIKIEMKSVIRTFSIEKYLQSFCHTLIYLAQIYFFSTSMDFESKYFLYIICWITLRLLFSAMNYVQTKISQNINSHFFLNNYYGIGDLFRKSIFVTECFNLIFYFPFKFLFQYLLGMLIFNKENLHTILTIPGEICKEKLSNFLYLNFYALLMHTFSSILGDIMYTFKMNSIININSILRVIINITFCRYFNKKDTETYLMDGIGYANIITEAFSFIFLFLMQHIKNPYPQAWLKVDLKLFSADSFNSITSLLQVIGFFSFEILQHWDDFFLLIYSCISLNKENIQTLSMLFSLMIFKHLFFYIKRKDKEEIIEYYQQIQENSSTSMFNKLSYEYDSPNQNTKGNYQWMLFIKMKIMGTILFNFTISIVYIAFYFFGGFKILNQTIDGWWYIVPFFVLNGIVEQCSNQTKSIREYLLKKDSLVFILIALGISLLCFVLVNILIPDYPVMLILGIYLGYYFLLYRFYPEIKNIDMRIVNLEMLIHNNNSDTPYIT